MCGHITCAVTPHVWSYHMCSQTTCVVISHVQSDYYTSSKHAQSTIKKILLIDNKSSTN